MAIWTVSNLYKKSCEEHTIWTKDNRSFKIIQGYRWGTWTIETSDDKPPQGLDAANPEGINMNDYSGDNAKNGTEFVSMDDGWMGDFEFDEDEFTEEEQEQIQELWDEDFDSGLESAGWTNWDTEAWLFGPLEIKNEVTGETIRGDEITFDELAKINPADEEWTRVEITDELQDLFQEGLGNKNVEAAWPFPEPKGDK